jgi:hypothetical protein
MIIYYKIGIGKKLHCALIEDKYASDFIKQQTLRHGKLFIVDITDEIIKPKKS